MTTRPYLFVGSSSEGLTVAKAIQLNLDTICEVVLWSQGVFGLSDGTLEALVKKIPTFDFGVLVLTPDDLIQTRGKNKQSPRDNVLIELGICLGALGRERTFIVYDRSSNIKLPSDLAGVTLATYHPPLTGNFQSALGAASTLIEEQVRLQKRRCVHSPSLARPLKFSDECDEKDFRQDNLSVVERIRRRSCIAFLPCTQRFDVSPWIRADHWVRLDLEAVPPILTFEDPAISAITGFVENRPATDEDLLAILEGVTHNPPLPKTVSSRQIVSFLTSDEENAIRTIRQSMVRDMLLGGDESFNYEVFRGVMREAADREVLSQTRLEQILQCREITD